MNDLIVMSGGTSVRPLWRMVRSVPTACSVGKGVQRQASELDVGVEPVGERLRDALGEDL